MRDAGALGHRGVALLSTRDYGRMLDLAVSILDRPGLDGAWQLVVEELVRSLGGTVGVLSEVRWTPGAGRVHVWTPESVRALPLDSILNSHIRLRHPLARHYATTTDRTPLAITDLVEERVWRHSEAYALTRRTFQSTRHFAIPLATTAGTGKCFVIHRDGRDFDEHERAYAQRLQPLLTSVDAHLRYLRGQPGSIPAQGGQRAAQAVSELGLTPRETAVLGLLGDALTAEAIGRRLGITTRTVHKHIEKLYRKLGVSNRLAAVLRAQETGLLSTPPGPCPASTRLVRP